MVKARRRRCVGHRAGCVPVAGRRDSMIRHYEINQGRLVENASAEGPVLLCVEPDDAERRRLVEEYRLDEHTLNSSLDPDELSRVETEVDHVAVILKRPKRYSTEDNFLFRVSSAGLFLFRDRLLIVLPEDAPIFETRRFNQVRSLPDILLRVINSSILHFEEHLKVINMLTDALEREVNRAMENRHLLHLFTLEKSLVYYLNAIGSNGRLLARLKVSATRLGFGEVDVELLEDVIIENSQCYEQAEIYSQVLSGLMDARASIVSNNLNVLMKTLTLVMIAIMLPTFVISVFSMNVPLPFGETPGMVPFWLIMVMAAASTGLVLLTWRLKRW
jgi:magnesium transporter